MISGALRAFVLFLAASLTSLAVAQSERASSTSLIASPVPNLQIEAFDGMPEMSPTQGYLARFLTNSPENLKLALMRAEALFDKGVVSSDDQALVFVVHGPEVGVFFRKNYSDHKELVDLAAKLSAFQVIDIRVCRTRLESLGESALSLPPFVKSVPFGPAEVERLVEREKYVYF